MMEIKERKFATREEEMEWIHPIKYPCLCGGVMDRKAGDSFYKYSYTCGKCHKEVYGPQRSVIDDDFQLVTDGKKKIIVDTEKCKSHPQKNF
jgi:hypothetical protein